MTGYSVAAKPAAGERPIWYGGGHLGLDLALPAPGRVARHPQSASVAAAEWVAAKRHRRPVRAGREMAEPSPQLWVECGRELEQLRAQLRSVPIDDREAWARVARQTAGAFAAWSHRARAGRTAPTTSPGSPIPNPLTPQRHRTPAGPQRQARDPDHGR